jgi:hypothetical protein
VVSQRGVVKTCKISCKVWDRLRFTSVQWELPGAEAILKLRATHSNGDFDDYWTWHLAQEHQRVHHSRYRPATIT